MYVRCAGWRKSAETKIRDAEGQVSLKRLNKQITTHGVTTSVDSLPKEQKCGVNRNIFKAIRAFVGAALLLATVRMVRL